MVTIMKNKLFTNTYEIAKGVGNQHETVMRLLKVHSNLDTFKSVKFEKVNTKGRPIDLYWLTEEQASLLILLMKNSEKTIKFKEKLNKAFFELRQVLADLMAKNQNLEWLEKRKETKVIRRELTDMIQEFIEYAKNQGSKSAEKYYMSISRMELTGLFLLEQKYPNYRDLMDFKQLNLIETADELIARSLKEAMNQGLNYKKCYAYAKEQIGRLAALFPKSPLPKLLENHSI